MLNKQINRTPTGDIVYKYDLIDDFDSEICTFNFDGPVGFLSRIFLRYYGQNQAVALNNSVNSQYGKVNDHDSEEIDFCQPDSDKPQRFEVYNHMLFLMVSVQCII